MRWATEYLKLASVPDALTSMDTAANHAFSPFVASRWAGAQDSGYEGSLQDYAQENRHAYTAPLIPAATTLGGAVIGHALGHAIGSPVIGTLGGAMAGYAGGLPASYYFGQLGQNSLSKARQNNGH
jgi:hypothetical protein